MQLLRKFYISSDVDKLNPDAFDDSMKDKGGHKKVGTVF